MLSMVIGLACHSVQFLIIYVYIPSEPFNDNGTLGSDIFSDTIGPDYIALALQAARAADPQAKLFINDFNIEGTGRSSPDDTLS